MTEPRQTEVYYDGACPVCIREIDFMRSRRGGDAITFSDVSDPSTPIPDDLDRERALSRFHVRTSDGALHDGAEGFVAMWNELPALRPLARFARLPGVLPILERLYRGFLRVRPVLQRVVGAYDRRRARRAARKA